MGTDIRGYFSRTHAGVDSHEVYLHQPVRVSVLYSIPHLYDKSYFHFFFLVSCMSILKMC